MIAGEEEIGAAEREGEMVRRMAGRRDGLEPEAPRLDDAAIRDDLVRRKLGIASGVRARGLPGVERTRGTVGSGRGDRRAGQSLERPGRERMVAMRMGDEDGGNAGAADGVAERIQMRRVVRTRVDDDKIAIADQIGVRAAEGEGAGIGCCDAAHARDDLHGIAVAGVEIAVEDQRHIVPVTP